MREKCSSGCDLIRTDGYRAVRMREKSYFSRYDLVRTDGYRAVRMREKSCFSRYDFIMYRWISGGAHAREKLLLSVRFYRV